MEIKEIISTLEIAAAEVEWNYPLDYSVALEEAIKLLKEYSLEKEKHAENI